ncbi:MAG: endonuclease Q family protein [Promethearchaeota archaeon]
MPPFVADLHVHGRFSGGSSRNLTLPQISRFAESKGIDLIGTGDFTYHKWLKEIRENLESDDSGFFKTKGNAKVRFALQTEVNIRFPTDTEKRGKRIHQIILAPSLDTAEQINEILSRWGNLQADARPTLTVSAAELVESIMEIDNRIETLPAHIFTPWFSLFGSFSGFDSIRDCYGSAMRHIHAVETGLSADPTYLWALSQLDDLAILSNSDLHSYYPNRIGREVTIFNLDNLTYREIIGAIRSNDDRITMTLEFKPGEGKYNYDGCRSSRHKKGEDLVLHPREFSKYGGRCPICGRRITTGVLHRIYDLADRKIGFSPKGAKPFKHIVPLTEVISYASGIKSPWSKEVLQTYFILTKAFGSEYNIWLNDEITRADLEQLVDEDIAKAIHSVKRGEFTFSPPGHDGEYGVLKVGAKQDDSETADMLQIPQKRLDSFV